MASVIPSERPGPGEPELPPRPLFIIAALAGGASPPEEGGRAGGGWAPASSAAQPPPLVSRICAGSGESGAGSGRGQQTVLDGPRGLCQEGDTSILGR